MVTMLQKVKNWFRHGDPASADSRLTKELVEAKIAKYKRKLSDLKYSNLFWTQFNRFTEIDSEAAEILGTLECPRESPLDLDGLRNLSSKAAGFLSGHKGPLLLSGLTALSDDVAESLGKHSGFLGL